MLISPTLNWLAEQYSSPPLAIGDENLGPIVIDSRKIAAGDTFWALQGTRDGHEFVIQALQAGAKACVISENWAAQTGAANVLTKCIVVPDTTRALAEAATRWRQCLSGVVIGLTGSNGKTTTKDLIARLLTLRYKTASTQGNLNNHLGVPLTLLSIPADAELAVIEMGANAPNEIGQLCKVAKPQQGIVTSIGRAHLAGFGTIAALAQTKGQLYDAVAEHGVGFVPFDDELCRVEASSVRNIVGYTLAANGHEYSGEVYRGTNFTVYADGSTSFEFEGQPIRLAVPGYPTALASLAALTVAKYHHVDIRAAAESLQEWRGTAGRGQVLELGTLRVIDDSYNANPNSVRAAVQTLSSMKGPRLAILGSMAELGEYSSTEHYRIVEDLHKSSVDRTLFVGTDWQPYVSQQDYYETTDALLPNLEKIVGDFKVVLLKGSHCIGLERAVDRLREQFG